MKILELKCLGEFSVSQDGAPVAGLKSGKGQALFCYLAVTGKRCSRSALAGMFWDEMPESQALMNLRKVLNRLKPLSAYLLIERESLSFNPHTPHRIDVKEFEAAVASRFDVRSLQAAASLYKGDFLEGYADDEMRLFADWARSERMRLRETALEVTQTLFRHFSGLHDYPTAIQYTRQYLALEAWSEEAHRDLMLLLTLSGQRGAAIQQYELCRRILKEELGVEPLPATVHLYEQIVAGKLIGSETVAKSAVALGPPSLHNLPAMPSPLIGRLDERATLLAYLANAQIRLVSIAGAGGMGKSHLALSLAHELVSGRMGFEGIFYVPLGAVTTRQHFVMAVANRLNLSLSGARDPEKLLLAFLQDKHFLIVLDNFEQLLAEEDLLEQILEAAPRTKLLLTTRERTRLHQEWVLDLQGLPYPEDGDAFRTTDALQLFVQGARQQTSGFSLEKNYPAVVRICRLVQGMPLALELAASWIHVMTPAEIADQIAQSYHSLSGELRNLPERHRTMQAVFDSSWNWLSAGEQSVMRRLSVFRGGFSLVAAREVAGASVPVLSALVDKSFLRLDARSSEVTRYQVHELVRQYAADQLQASGEAASVQDRHLDYFLSLTEQAEKAWDTPQEPKWLQRFEEERANLHAALGWAVDQEKAEILLRMNAALFTFWLYRSPVSEGHGWLEATLALDKDKKKAEVLRLRAKVLNVAGYSAIVIPNHALAQSRFEEGLALYTLLGDRQEMAWSLRGCGFIAMIQGDYPQARPFVEQSLAICQEIQDEWGAAWSVYDLGYLAMARGDLVRARPLLDDAYQQFKQHGILWGEFRALVALGDVLRRQEQATQAESRYREALAFHQQYQFIQFVADIFEGLAQLATASGESLRAARLLGAAQKRRETVEHSHWSHQVGDYQLGLSRLRDQLAGDAIATAWDEGSAMSTAEATAYAMEVRPPAG